MADTADRRSEGDLSMTDSAIQNRLTYRHCQAHGICVSCKTKEVRGRSYCYDCSITQKLHTYRTGLRHFMTDAGLDNTTNVLNVVEGMIDRHQLSLDEMVLLNSLLVLISKAHTTRKTT